MEEVSYDSVTLLRALSLYTNKSLVFCEKLVIKYMQTLFISTKVSVKNRPTKKQSGWYNVVLGEDEYISLQKITSIYVTTIHLKWYSKISIYVALVKSETQESTGFFLDKTKIKPLPRATEVEWKQSK